MSSRRHLNQAWSAALMPCTHNSVEEIRNGNDVVLGGQCTTCLTLLWGVGKCAGCGKDPARLTYVIDERRYCNAVCRQNELAKERAAKTERERERAAKAKATSGPGR